MLVYEFVDGGIVRASDYRDMAEARRGRRAMFRSTLRQADIDELLDGRVVRATLGHPV